MKDIRKYFEELDHIPQELPQVDPETWKDVVIPNLIRVGAIPKKELLDGHTYFGNCRNAERAIWNADKNVFTYTRIKFGSSYPEDINHFEDDDGYDLFIPIKDEGEIH